MKRSLLVIALLAFVSCAVTGYAEDYIVQPGDRLGITVVGETELTRQVVVDPKGSITLPLVNEVQVAGLTPGRVAKELTSRLRKFLRNPQVSVELVEAGKIQVTVSGDVRSPGIYTLAGGSCLMDAITAAGGYLQTADLSKVTVSRAGSTGPARTVDLSLFIIGGDTSVNLPVRAGDTIVIPGLMTNVIGSVRVLGAVRQSGEHQITQGMTVREAIMLAGGPTEIADLTKVTLRHANSPEAIPFDYTLGEMADVELKPGDVIFVNARQQLGFYSIQGAVANPGKYELKERTTVTEAVAIAGGVRGRARLGDVRILRSSGGEVRTLRASVSNILAGTAENIELKDGDNIYVPERKEKPDIMRIISLALSLGWLLTK